MAGADLFDVIIPLVPACEIKDYDGPRMFLSVRKGLQFNPEHLQSYVVRAERVHTDPTGWYYLSPTLKDGLPVLWSAGADAEEVWFHEAFKVFPTIELAELGSLVLWDVCKAPVEILQIHLKGNQIHLFRVAQIASKESVGAAH
jgi:hypothetical protein